MIAANLMDIDIPVVNEGERVDIALKKMMEMGRQQLAVVDDERRIAGFLTAITISNFTLSISQSKVPLEEIKSFFNTTFFLGSFEDVLSKRVYEIMERDYKKVSPETPAAEVATMLVSSEKQIGCVAVVDDRDVLLGIITPLDILNRLWEHTRDGKER